MAQVFGPNELVEDVQKGDLCIGCGACVNLCPYFKNYRGKTAMLFPCTLEKGRCFGFCPKVEVDLDELSTRFWNTPYDGRPLGHYNEVVSARAGDKIAGEGFKGGGTVSALMTFALQEDLIDAAVLTGRRGMIAEPRLVTRVEDIFKCASSKFMAAPTLAVLNQGVAEGYRKMGIVGTPCQLTAVAQMRTNPTQKEDFADPVALTVGLFCNWALDTRQLEALLSEKIDISGIRGMDIPPPPANMMILDTETGRVEVPLSEIKPLIPETCFICPDMSAEFSDVSVGMYEGRPGWNTLIVRTEKGAELVDKANREGFLETDEFPADNLKHLSGAAADKKARALRMLIRRELINTENGRRSALRMSPEVVEQLLNK